MSAVAVLSTVQITRHHRRSPDRDTGSPAVRPARDPLVVVPALALGALAAFRHADLGRSADAGRTW